MLSIRKGDKVLFSKNGQPITGTIQFICVDHVDDLGRTWLYLEIGHRDFPLKFTLLEDDIEITKYSASRLKSAS